MFLSMDAECTRQSYYATGFYSAAALLATAIPSVRLSVTLCVRTQTNEDRIMRSSL